MEIIKIIAVAVAFAVAVWVLYTLVKMSDRVKDAPDEAPYKVEPADTAPDLAVSSSPKRSYTKRSGYCTAKRKKAAASKAKKQTSKSK